MIDRETIKKPFWALTVEEVLRILETKESGLDDEEAESRLKIFGPNVLEKERRFAKLKIFLNQFKSPLILILVVAGVIVLFLERFEDALVIFAAVIVNTALGFYQDNKADEALAHLKTYINQITVAIRAGRKFEIAV